jgi:Zn-dependent alcohol dehydrogenase
MKINAAILWEQGKPLSVEETELDAPQTGEVLVEVKSAGVCHSDLHPALGDWPARLPIVLGHEGAGIVREVGEGVSRLRKGDHVVFCWQPACGKCPPCLEGRPVLCDRLDKTTYRGRLPGGGMRLHARGKDVGHFNGTACFADFAVIAEEGAVAVSQDLPFDVLATLGCAVVTGVGAVLNAAAIKPWSSVVVIGAGGVGLNVIQAAAIADCKQIITVDTRPEPLKMAAEFGSTHQVISAGDETAIAVKELTDGRGADYVFDTVANPATVAQALALSRKGGTIVLTGLAKLDARASLPIFPFVMQEKRLIGSVYGSGQPLSDIVKLAELYLSGKLKLRELVAARYNLDQVNQALSALSGGTVARGIIEW